MSALWQNFFSSTNQNQQTIPATHRLNQENSQVSIKSVHQKMERSNVKTVFKIYRKIQNVKGQNKRAIFPSQNYRCPECPKKCSQRTKLKDHMVAKHKTEATIFNSLFPSPKDKKTKAFPCPLESCARGYTHYRDIKRHVHTEHQDNKDLIWAIEELKNDLI